ncbi:META domain-containing protein [Cellulomonas sp. URHB0016]
MGRRAAVLALVTALAVGALAACADDGGGSGGDASAAVSTSPSGAASSASSGDPVGTWGTSSTGEAYLVLAKDGTVTGSDGCNQLSGTWKSASDGVTFSPFAATQMFCADVDTWLGRATSAQVQGDELVLSGEDGTQIGTLQRTA